MADYAVTGRKGAGKTLFAVGVIGDALRAGKRVATNLDLYLDHLLPPTSRAVVTRLPDKPTAADLEAIGRGQDSPVEDCNGLIVLDETSTFFNSRAYGDRERQPLLDWLVHSRKLGWDVYYICQGLEQIDKQLRSSMIEYHIVVKRTDKWPVPLLTPLCKLVGFDLRLPKMHIGITKHGCDRDSLVVDRKFYRARDLFGAYDTQQLFLERSHPKSSGLHTVLSAWHIKGRHLPARPGFLYRFWCGLVGRDWAASLECNERALKPKRAAVQRLAGLPPDDAVRIWRALDQRGLI